MKIYFSDKHTFVIELSDNGEAWLCREDHVDGGFLVLNNDELVELFGFMCEFIIDHVIEAWRLTPGRPNKKPNNSP